MLSLLVPCLLALPGGDGPLAPARPADWSALDARVARLGLGPDAGPVFWGVLLRSYYTFSAEEASAGTTDIAGLVFEDVDLFACFDQEGLAMRVSADFADQTAALEDAYARLQLEDDLGVEGGQFKPRVVRSGSIPESELILRDRTFLGAAFDAWDVGVGLDGHYDQFDYWLALSDGANGSRSKPFWSARVEWALFDAAFADREGARGAPNHLQVLLGLMTFEDAGQSAGRGGGFGADLALTFGPYAFHGEYANLDSGFAREIDVFNGYLLTIGDGEPRAATLSRRLGDTMEAAARFQQADDADSTHAFDLGLGWRPENGPARFTAEIALVDGDTRDFSLVSFGVQIGSSGITRPYLNESWSR